MQTTRRRDGIIGTSRLGPYQHVPLRVSQFPTGELFNQLRSQSSRRDEELLGPIGIHVLAHDHVSPQSPHKMAVELGVGAIAPGGREVGDFGK